MLNFSSPVSFRYQLSVVKTGEDCDKLFKKQLNTVHICGSCPLNDSYKLDCFWLYGVVCISGHLY